ncbi:Gustatory receptor [Balamuthia mandrillaris]
MLAAPPRDSNKGVASAVVERLPLREVEVMNKVGEDALGDLFQCLYRERDCTAHLVRMEEPSLVEEFCSEASRVQTELSTKCEHLEQIIGVVTEREGCVLLVSEGSYTTAEHLLQQSVVSFTTKMAWARSVAQAMLFLNGRDSQYTHAQLNIRHVLVSKDMNKAVLSNYAFSKFRTQRKRLSEYNWQSPERLSNLPSYNGQSSDVYSYGILLWQLVTQKMPFQTCKSLSEMIAAICEANQRPSIPEDCPERLMQLMTSCWSSNPERRPTFEQIVEAFGEILLEFRVEDELGRKFWKRHFMDKDRTDWESFYTNFYAFLKLDPPKPTDIKLVCLNALMEELGDAEQKGVVTLKQFSDMLEWFGPLEGPGILDRIHEQLSQGWFHGKLSGAEAEKAVLQHPHGSFLFRFSSSEPGSYAITVHSKRGSVKHFRVRHRPGLNYLIGKTECKTLNEIIFVFKKDLNLQKPCPGSKFQQLFKVDNFLVNRYQDWEDGL